MQIDIAAHIEKLLFEHETLIIPTFGCFTSTKSPAAVDFIGGAVAPPSKTLAFNENLTIDDGVLVHEISHANGISTDEARRVILDYVENTKAALNQREIVTFPGVGRLYKNYAQKIQFLPDTTNFNTEAYGLPPLQFSPIARAREQGEYTPMPATPQPAASASSAVAVQEAPPEVSVPAPVATVAAPPVSEPKPQVQPQVAPPVVERTQQPNPMRSMAAFGVGLLLFALAVGIYFMRQKKNAALAISDKTENAAPLSVLPNPASEMLNKAKEEEQAKIAAEKNKAASSVEDDKEDDTADEVEEAAAKKIEATSKEKLAKKEDKIREAQKEAKSAEPSNGEKRCVLVVGTYKDKENALKVLDKIKAAGLDSYYRIQKGHQVGIEFNYNNLTEIQDKIKTLQKVTGEQDIWIKKK